MLINVCYEVNITHSLCSLLTGEIDQRDQINAS